MRIAIYARVSTSDGRQDLENQLSPLRAWANHNGSNIVEEYCDEVSGAKNNRKAFNLMMEDAYRRKFDVLMVWALDRLTREGVGKMLQCLERLKACGIRVVSHQETWLDTNGPVSDLLIAIFGWVASQERQRIRERVLAGLKTAKAKGKKLGRPVRVVNLPKILELRSQGQTMREIAQSVGVPRSTIAKALSQKPHAVETQKS